MNCKGIKVPLDNYLLITILSSLYTPITVAGNLLMILAIIIDPLKELRTFPNFIYINVLLSDFCFGLLIDPYRAWGNKIRYDDIDLKKEYPYAVPLGKTCHIFYLAGELIALFALTVMSADLLVHKSVRKVSCVATVMISICIWVLAYGLALFYIGYGFRDVEFIINSVTGFGCLVSIIVNYFILYRPAKKSLIQVHVHPPPSSVGDKKTANNAECESTFEMEPKMSRKDDGAKANEVEINKGIAGKSCDDKESATTNERASSAEPERKHLRSIEALLLYYALLIIFTGSSCAVIYAGSYDGIYLSCYSTHMLEAWRFMFVITHKVFNPWLCLLIVPALRRSCLQLFRFRRYRRTAPMA